MKFTLYDGEKYLLTPFTQSYCWVSSALLRGLPPHLFSVLCVKLVAFSRVSIFDVVDGELPLGLLWHKIFVGDVDERSNDYFTIKFEHVHLKGSSDFFFSKKVFIKRT